MSSIRELHPPTLVRIAGKKRKFLAYDETPDGKFVWCLLAKYRPHRGRKGGAWHPSDNHEGWMPVLKEQLVPVKLKRHDSVSGAGSEEEE